VLNAGAEMTEERTILVTGATGKLGRAVVAALLRRGQRVRATDLRFSQGFPVRVELGDLKDELFVYRVMEGCASVVHLGNHPNAMVGISPQRLLSENTAMNANVFQAAADLGVRTLVFASSVQATVRRDKNTGGPPHQIPYLPLDGELPCNPGLNTYAQSKEFAERLLRLFSLADPELSVTALRFPMLVNDWLQRRFSLARRLRPESLDFEECTAHLYLEDAGELVADVLARHLPGYHQYFPALTMELRGYPLDELVRDRYPNAELRCPLAELESLIDISAITRDLGWVPRERISLEIERSSE
jgi:nucleoside-diphosphate-sugar epimerase